MTRTSPHEEHPDRLPWYAAGTLGSGERAAIDAHLRGCAECRAELERWSALGRVLRAEAGDHPSVEELTKFAEATLTTADASEIERHLSSCEACRADVEVARGLCSPGEVPASRQRWGKVAALVAGVGIALTLLAWIVDRVRSGPEVHVARRIVLEPPYRSGGETAEGRLLGAGPWSVTLVLPDTAEGGPYRLTIVDTGSGRPVHQAAEVSVDAGATVDVVLAGLDPGAYVARLEGPAAAPVAHDFRFVVER
jgi:hypothetical protein